MKQTLSDRKRLNNTVINITSQSFEEGDEDSSENEGSNIIQFISQYSFIFRFS